MGYNNDGNFSILIFYLITIWCPLLINVAHVGHIEISFLLIIHHSIIELWLTVRSIKVIQNILLPRHKYIIELTILAEPITTVQKRDNCARSTFTWRQHRSVHFSFTIERSERKETRKCGATGGFRGIEADARKPIRRKVNKPVKSCVCKHKRSFPSLWRANKSLHAQLIENVADEMTAYTI